jgi:hypothetical protein
MLSLALVRQFRGRFRGYSKAYGSYEVDKADELGKIKGRAKTHKGEVSDDFVRAHLRGDGPGWGSIALLDDDTVVFAAIDIDDRGLDLEFIARNVAALTLPLVVCRSKSGGAHLYLFTREPVSAMLVRQRLQEWAALLGCAANVELFPKQTTRYNESDLGNWLNIPYYGGDNTERYALNREGTARLDLREFLELADVMAVTGEQVAAFSSTDSITTTLFDEGPPCLQLLEQRGGFVQGTKKLGMFNVGVYLRKAFPDDWEEKIGEYNKAMAQLNSSELSEVVKSCRKRDYSYLCKQTPINAVCQRTTCRLRKFGIGQTQEAELAIESITRHHAPDGDEPYFILQLNGNLVRMTTEQLYSPDAFNKACISQGNLLPIISVTAMKWKQYIQELLSRADTVAIPVEATPSGAIWENVQLFCIRQIKAVEKEEMREGKVYHSPDGKFIFRGSDLFSYFDQKRAPYKSRQAVWEVLRNHGAIKEFWNVNEKGINVWIIDSASFDEKLKYGAGEDEEEEPLPPDSTAGENIEQF